jgi:hypothetical protein
MYLTNTLDSTFITIITKYKIDHVNLAYILFSMLALHLFFYASILQVQAVLISELKQKLTPHTTRTQSVHTLCKLDLHLYLKTHAAERYLKIIRLQACRTRHLDHSGASALEAAKKTGENPRAKTCAEQHSNAGGGCSTERAQPTEPLARSRWDLHLITG